MDSEPLLTNNWKVYWANDPRPGKLAHVDLRSGIVTLADGRTHDIAGMAPEQPVHWPFVHRLITRWIAEGK